MRIFAIVDATKRKRIPAAWLYYNENTRKFSALINKVYPVGKLPMAFEPWARRGFFELEHDQVMPWVEERIVPHNRQNIGMILEAHGLAEYDEFALLLASRGFCSQDNFVIKEITAEEAAAQQASPSKPIDNGYSALARMLGERIEALREENELTQAELAYEIGISQGALSNLEKGKGNPTLSTLVDIANALDIDAWRLLN